MTWLNLLSHYFVRLLSSYHKTDNPIPTIPSLVASILRFDDVESKCLSNTRNSLRPDEGEKSFNDIEPAWLRGWDEKKQFTVRGSFEALGRVLRRHRLRTKGRPKANSRLNLAWFANRFLLYAMGHASVETFRQCQILCVYFKISFLFAPQQPATALEATLIVQR